MKKLLRYLGITLAVVTLTLSVGCSKVNEMKEGIDDIKGAAQNVEEAVKEAEGKVDEIRSDVETAMNEEATDEEADYTSVESDSSGEVLDGMRDTSGAIKIEDEIVYTGSIESGESVQYLFEAQVGEEAAFYIKTDGRIIGTFREVMEDENSNNGFYIDDEKGIFTYECKDGSELLYLKNENKGRLEYALIAIHGDKETLEQVLVDAETILLATETEVSMNEHAFLLGSHGIYVQSVEVFTQDIELDIPRYDGKLYFRLKGSYSNNSEEAMSYYDSVSMVVLDSQGNRCADASEWLGENGLKSTVNKGETLDIQQLYTVDSRSKYLTVIYTDRVSAISNRYVIDIKDLAALASKELDEAATGKIETLEELASKVVTSIGEDAYMDVAQMGEYIIITSVQTQPYTLYQGMEYGYWEQVSTYEEPLVWGLDNDGQEINVGFVELFDSYFKAFDYPKGTMEVIKNNQDGSYPNPLLDSRDIDYYVVITSPDSEHILYVTFEEVGEGEFVLNGLYFSV